MTNTTTVWVGFEMANGGATAWTVVSLDGTKPVGLAATHPWLEGFVALAGQTTTCAMADGPPKPEPVIVNGVPPAGDALGGSMLVTVTP